MRFKVALLALALCAVSAAPSASMGGEAYAQSIQPIYIDPRSEHRHEREDRGNADQPRILPWREIVRRVQRQLGGEPIGPARPPEYDGRRPFYVLSWRRGDGVVDNYVRVDAETGQMF
jgi:hypothetical protein